MLANTVAAQSPKHLALGSAAQAWEEVKKLTVPDAAANDRFGDAVAIDQNTVVIGVPGDDDHCPMDPLCNSGAIFVFERNQGGANNWGEVQKITASDVLIGDQFGDAVAIDGDTLIVGSLANLGGTFNSGGVYVFGRNPSGSDNWGEVTTLRASDASGRELFGQSVSIDLDTVVVGATWDDDACPSDPNCNSGAAYVFERNQGTAGTWKEVQKITAADAELGDGFGSSVAIDGDVLVVTTIRSFNNGSNAGAAYIFERDPNDTGNWAEVKKISASDADLGDQFGSAVALDGDMVLVGAHFDDEAASNSGAAYLFGRDQGGSGAWGELAKLTASDADIDDFFGNSVSFFGNTVLVGARGNNDGGSDSGAVYVFERDQSGAKNWIEVIKLTAADQGFGDQFGFSLAIDGDDLVIGAARDSNVAAESGSTYVFTNTLAAIFANGFETGNISAWSNGR